MEVAMQLLKFCLSVIMMMMISACGIKGLSLDADFENQKVGIQLDYGAEKARDVPESARHTENGRLSEFKEAYLGVVAEDHLEVGPQTARLALALSPSVKPILDLVGRAEGTDLGDGYDETLGYGAFTGGDVILTAMTLAEIDKLQTEMLGHSRNHFKSAAIGRYQITRTTLRMLKTQLGLSEEALFTATLQDMLAIELLKRRGYVAWKVGKIDDRQFALNLAQEWASLPNPHNGKSYYQGQKAAVDYTTVKDVLKISK
jgi:muramidase (phage lysozyme)